MSEFGDSGSQEAEAEGSQVPTLARLYYIVSFPLFLFLKLVDQAELDLEVTELCLCFPSARLFFFHLVLIVSLLKVSRVIAHFLGLGEAFSLHTHTSCAGVSYPLITAVCQCLSFLSGIFSPSWSSVFCILIVRNLWIYFYLPFRFLSVTLPQALPFFTVGKLM